MGGLHEHAGRRSASGSWPSTSGNAHLAGQEDVLEIGRVEGAGRQQHDLRPVDPAGATLGQRRLQALAPYWSTGRTPMLANSSGNARSIMVRFSIT